MIALIPRSSPVVLALLLGEEAQRGYRIYPQLHSLEGVLLGGEPSKSDSRALLVILFSFSSGYQECAVKGIHG